MDISKRQENFERAREYMKKHIGEPLTHELINSIHAEMEQVHGYRTGSGAPPVKNDSKIVYWPPVSNVVYSIPAEMQKLLELHNRSQEPAIELAAKLHWGIVKIHPFLDGNGRTARILFSFVLLNHGYDDNVCKKLEEHFESNKKEYFDALDDGQISYLSYDNASQQWLAYVCKAYEEVKSLLS